MAKIVTPAAAFSRACVAYVNATAKAGASLWGALVACINQGGIEAARVGHAQAADALRKAHGDTWASSQEYKTHRSIARYISVAAKALEKGHDLAAGGYTAAEKAAYAKPAANVASDNDNDEADEVAPTKGERAAKKTAPEKVAASEADTVAAALEILKRDAGLRVRFVAELAEVAARAAIDASAQQARKEEAAKKAAVTKAAKGKAKAADKAAAVIAAAA